MIIYIRHASDQYEDPTFLHDQKIVKTKENIENALNVAKFLIKEYGQPEVVICSPFERAKGTLNIMRKVFDNNPEIKYDTRVSRYFTSKEKKEVDIRKETQVMLPPVYESWSKFKVRVQDHINTLVEDATLKSRHKVVWVITHTLVIKEVAKHLKIETPDYFEFLLWMAIRSHGPEFNVSYVAVGNGPGNVKVIQKDVNREKSRIRREKTLRGDLSDNDDKRHKKGKGKKKDDDDDFSDSDESSDDLLYDICDPEEERKKIEMEKERERELEKERKRKAKERDKYEKKAREKQTKYGNKKSEIVKPTTMDDHIKRQISIKKEQEQHQRRLFGAGIDGHVNDERRIQYKVDRNSVQKKQEMAKGTNIDDFARILFK